MSGHQAAGSWGSPSGVSGKGDRRPPRLRPTPDVAPVPPLPDLFQCWPKFHAWVICLVKRALRATRGGHQNSLSRRGPLLEVSGAERGSPCPCDWLPVSISEDLLSPHPLIKAPGGRSGPPAVTPPVPLDPSLLEAWVWHQRICVHNMG